MQAAVTPDPADEGRDEIRGLIADNQLDRALHRLMDYARDFSSGRSLENAAVGLSARLNQLGVDIREFGATTETQSRHAALVKSMLALADQIYSSRTTPGTPSSNVIRSNPCARLQHGDMSSAASAGAEAEAPARHPTAWEAAKERFLRAQSEFPHEARKPSRIAFSCKALSKHYRKQIKCALEGVDIELRLGEITGVVGLNGSGKTTLLRIIAGNLAASGGSLEYPALTAGDFDWRLVRQRIGYVSQYASPWPGSSVGACLNFQAALAGYYGRDNRDEVNYILHRLGLSAYRDHRWDQLSRGFQLRLDLALVLLSRASLLVLDEPLAPLDVATKYLFLQALRDLASSRSHPIAVILSSQDISEVEMISDSILILRDGRVFMNRPIKELGNERDHNVFELSCSLSGHELVEALAGVLELRVYEVAGVLIVTVPKTKSAGELLHALLGIPVEITFFRDVSHSSRRILEMGNLEA